MFLCGAAWCVGRSVPKRRCCAYTETATACGTLTQAAKQAGAGRGYVCQRIALVVQTRLASNLHAFFGGKLKGYIGSFSSTFKVRPNSL